MIDESLPSARSNERQLTLFETRLLSYGAVRTAVGKFYEQATATLTSGVLLKTDSRKTICPDLHLGDNRFAEIKATGRNNAAIIYTHRLEKDKAFIELGNSLTYYVWSHSCKASKYQTAGELYQALAQCTRALYVVNASTLIDLLGKEPPRVMNTYGRTHKPTGWEKNGYGVGWSLRTKTLLELCNVCSDTPRLSVFGVDLQSVLYYQEIWRMPAAQYPWDEWLAYRLVTLVRGKQFDIEPNSLMIMIRRHAKNRGLDVSVSIDKDSVSIINRSV